jgi:pimeloyl-ACP methyl ester carboxylesterase
MSRLRPPRFEGAIQLESGRKLGYAEYGPTTGRPLVWFHGTPGARRQISPDAREAAYERDVRIIAVERPGIGDSTPHLYDSIIDFSEDMEQLRAALELEQFGIAGLSGGGPYALACAHQMPEYVIAVAVLGGVAPTIGIDAAEGGAVNLTRYFGPVVQHARGPLGSIMRGLVKGLEPLADQAIDLFAKVMPPGDQRVFADEAVREMFQDDLLRGSKTNMQALIADVVLFGRHWGFNLRDIQVPIHMWYGDADNIVPVEHGEHMAEIIPDSNLRIRPEEGHLGGLGASHEILDAILAHWVEDVTAAVEPETASPSDEDARRTPA